MNTYPLSIITPTGKVFEGPIESLVAPGLGGSLGVLAGHAPVVVTLKVGPLKIRYADVERYYAISTGTLEVSKQGTLILTDSAAEKPSFEAAQVPLSQG